MFSFATLIIHSAFQTSRKDPTINEASSYLDLSPLYGNNQKEQDTVRTHTQGELWPDTWARSVFPSPSNPFLLFYDNILSHSLSDRLGLMPPHVVALLVIFSR